MIKPIVAAALALVCSLAAFHKAEVEKWWPTIRAAGIKVE